MKLIFIEGITGVGKSTFAAKLQEALKNKGYSVDCYFENQDFVNNPINLMWHAYLTKDEYNVILEKYSDNSGEIIKNSICKNDYVLVRYKERYEDSYYSAELSEYLSTKEVSYKPPNPVPYDIFKRVSLDRWYDFINSDAVKHEYVIFDAILLQNKINDMLFNYSATEDDVVEYFKPVLQIIQPYNPVVFYMESQDLRERMRKIWIDRSGGKYEPDEEVYGFWEKRKHLDLHALDKLPIDTFKIDITNGYGDWMLDFVLKNLF